MTGESKFRGVIGDDDTGKVICADVHAGLGLIDMVFIYIATERIVCYHLRWTLRPSAVNISVF